MWAAAVVTALIMWPVSNDPLHHQPVTWLWQVVLVGIGVVLAAGPLRTLMRQHTEQQPAEVLEPAASLHPEAGNDEDPHQLRDLNRTTKQQLPPRWGFSLIRFRYVSTYHLTG